MVGLTCSPRCFGRLVLLGAAVSLLSAGTGVSSAQTCVQDQYQKVNKQKLNCTANDVRIAKVTNVRDPLTGQPITTCNGGSTFNFLADFEIVTSSSQARENIGLYIATNSQTTALTGACVDNIVSPLHPNATTGPLGSDNYHTTDPAPDNCGDTSSNDFSATFGKGAEKVTLEIDNFLCQAPEGSNQVQLPNCTSWQIPGGTIQCVANTTTWAYPFNGPGGTPTAIPGSPSKCNCDTIPLGVTVQTPGIDVGKACNTNATTTTPSFSKVGTQLTCTPNDCSITPEGGEATYFVEVANTSNFGSVVVDQICDTAYGQIYPVSGTTGTCNAGTQCSSQVKGTGCSKNTTCTGATIAQNSVYDCQFKADQAEDRIVTNIASALVHGATSNTTASGASNSVTVTSHEAATTATATKGVNSTRAGCATVRYSVDVANTSASGSDESVSITALNDSAFGDLTTCKGSANGCTSGGNVNILGTTCGVASGIGTLTGTAGAGTLPTSAIAVGGSNYTCYFDAQICSGLTNGCFTHSNTINATATGDEGDTVTMTATPDPLNVKVCVDVSVVP